MSPKEYALYKQKVQRVNSLEAELHGRPRVSIHREMEIFISKHTKNKICAICLYCGVIFKPDPRDEDDLVMGSVLSIEQLDYVIEDLEDKLRGRQERKLFRWFPTHTWPLPIKYKFDQTQSMLTC